LFETLHSRPTVKIGTTKQTTANGLKMDKVSYAISPVSSSKITKLFLRKNATA